MTVERETVPAPRLPRDEVLIDPARCHISADGDHLLAYDAEAAAGAIFDRRTHVWMVLSPITSAHWLRTLAASGLRPASVPQSDFDELLAAAERGDPTGSRH